MEKEKLEINQIYNMKDIELINRIEKNTVDAVITDPPYFIDIKGLINTDKNIWDSIDNVDELVKQSLLELVSLQKYFMFKYQVWDINKIELSKEDRIYIYFYTYIHNLVSSGILKAGATIMIFNTYANCQMLKDVLNELANDFGYNFYEFSYFEYTKYNAHPQAKVEKTSEYLIHVQVGKKRNEVPIERTHLYTYFPSKRLLDSSDDFTLRDKEIYDSINIDKGYYISSKDNNERIHDTQKPPKLLQYLISNFTAENETILDTFSGSGSIALACHELNRNFIACELSEINYKNSVKRLNHFKVFMPRKVFVNNLVDSHFSISNAQFKADKKYHLG